MQESFQSAADTDRMGRDAEFREFVYENVPKIIERFMYLREREASEDVSEPRLVIALMGRELKSQKL